MIKTKFVLFDEKKIKFLSSTWTSKTVKRDKVVVSWTFRTLRKGNGASRANRVSGFKDRRVKKERER